MAPQLSRFAVAPEIRPRQLQAAVKELRSIDRELYRHLYRCAVGTPAAPGPWAEAPERASREALGFVRVWRGFLPPEWSEVPLLRRRRVQTSAPATRTDEDQAEILGESDGEVVRC